MFWRIPFIRSTGLSFSFVTTTKRRGPSPQCNPFRAFYLDGGRQFFGTSLGTSRHGIIGEKQQNSVTNESTLNSTKDTSNKPPTKRRTWDENYALLAKYHQEHGHANVSRHWKGDTKLGPWVEAQRRRRNTLKPDKIAKLEALNFTWDGVAKEKYDQIWEQMFQCLEEFTEKEGHCSVPRSYKPNKKLFNWVNSQRKSYHLGKMPSDRIAKLESIGFVWRLKKFVHRFRDDYEEQWEDKFAELLEYLEENGHCRVPQESSSLGMWVQRQRTLDADGQLRLDRRERLDAIGFTFDFTAEILDEAWNKMYNQLAELSQLHEEEWLDPDNLDRQTWASKRKQLALWSWETNQQTFYRRGKLDPKRAALLDEIGYWNSLGLAKP